MSGSLIESAIHVGAAHDSTSSQRSMTGQRSRLLVRLTLCSTLVATACVSHSNIVGDAGGADSASDVTPTDACDAFATVWCNQAYECNTGAALMSLMQTYGATAQECATAYANPLNLNCLNPTAMCPSGTLYDTSAAEACVRAYEGLSCADILSQTTAAACALDVICH